MIFRHENVGASCPRAAAAQIAGTVQSACHVLILGPSSMAWSRVQPDKAKDYTIAAGHDAGGKDVRSQIARATCMACGGSIARA